jgi:tRNA pseudouridine55 synthase
MPVHKEQWLPVPRESHLHGLLVVDKPGLPPGESATAMPPPRLPTSHDVVQWVRRWSQQRRIGHTGTLDPLASGVLVLCLGHATRLVEYYQGHAKRYYAEIQLGAATDTYDALGQITATAAVPPLNAQHIDTALHQFRGAVLQSPPVYSALKQGGESVHRKARRGEEVSLAPRPVTFYELELVAWQPPESVILRVHCSAGAYIRSLAHDLGRALGTHAHLHRLRRESAGVFTLAEAHSVSTIEAASAQGRFAELLLPPGAGLALPVVQLDAVAIQRLGYGQKVVLATNAAASATDEPAGRLAQAVDEENTFLGILQWVGQAASGGDLWKAEKWFPRA